MYNVSAEGTFEKREIRKFVTTETIKNTKCNNFSTV
jgi:hypothetical protein